jgi:hypothetical protein
MCIDYRGLNAITDRDRYPLLYINNLLDRLYGSHHFSKLDQSSDYHQLYTHPNDSHKMALIAPEGLYEWLVMSFGLANAPMIFMQVMYRILRAYCKHAIVDLDNIMIHSCTQGDYICNVEALLQIIREARLHLNAEKFEFGVAATTFVGHRVLSKIWRKSR